MFVGTSMSSLSMAHSLQNTSRTSASDGRLKQHHYRECVADFVCVPGDWIGAEPLARQLRDNDCVGQSCVA